jgi:ABC-type Fe3+-citrate transport system substrate-binding protein
MSEFLDKMAALGEEQELYRLKHDAEVNAWWKALSQEDRERAFYAVVSRIFQAEIVEKRSYRGVLYDVFGFDAGMYVIGMECGYMTIHNSLVDIDEHNELQRKNAQLKLALQAVLAGNPEGRSIAEKALNE